MPRKPQANAKEYKMFASLAYKKYAGNIKARFKDQGYVLDNKLSDREHKGLIILQPKTVVADRRTDMCDPNRV